MFEMLITSSALIVLFTILRLVLKKRFSPRLRYALWLLVALRLLIPGSLFTLPFSLPALAEESGLMETVEEVRYTTEHETTYGTTSAPFDREDVLAYEDYPWFQEADWFGYQDITDIHIVDAQEVTPAEANGNPESDSAYARLELEITRDRFFALRVIWYAGMVLMALWLLFTNLRFRLSLQKTAIPAEVDSPLPVRVAPGLISPCLCGLLRPVIYVTPACVADGSRLRHVIAHEYTHYRQGDHIWSLVRCACLVVWWFNPLVWLAAALSRRDCELACDEGAISRLGEPERIPYGRTLVDMVAATQSPAALLHTATTMTGGKTSIAERVALIAKRPKMTVLTLVTVAVLVIFAAACAFGGANQTEEPDESPAVEEPEQSQPLSEPEPSNEPEQPLNLAEEYILNTPEEDILAFVLPATYPGKEFSNPAELTSYDLFTIAAFSVDYTAWYDEASNTHLIPVTDLTTVLDGYFEGYTFNPSDTGWGRYDPATGIHTAYFMDFNPPSYTLMEIHASNRTTFHVVLHDPYTFGVTVTVEITEEGPRIVSCENNGFAQEIAQAVYEHITGGDSFYMDIYTDTTETRILLNRSNTWNLPSDLSGYDWAHTTSQGSGTAMTIRLSSTDGETELRCFHGSDRVFVKANNQEQYLTATYRYDSDEAALFNHLRLVAEDALIASTQDIVIHGIGSANVGSPLVQADRLHSVVYEYAKQRAEKLNALPDWMESKPLETVVAEVSSGQAYFGEGTENFCGGYSLLFKLEDGNSSRWQAGSGMEQITEGEYAGWWRWGMGADFARNTDGDWVCTGHYTGGEQLTFPTKLENATLEELVYYFYHTTGGHAHDYLIPMYIVDQLPAKVDELGRLLQEQKDPTALMASIYNYLFEYGESHDIDNAGMYYDSPGAFGQNFSDYIQIPTPLTDEQGNKKGSSFYTLSNHHDSEAEQALIEFENGQIVHFTPWNDHTVFTDHQSIDGCAAPAAIAHSTYDPPYEDKDAGTYWVICFAEQGGYLRYNLSLDTAYFTRDEAMELARSVTFGYNAFLIPNYYGGR